MDAISKHLAELRAEVASITTSLPFTEHRVTALEVRVLTVAEQVAGLD